MFDDAAVEAADRAARIWAASETGPIDPGSEAHKTAFCRMLLDTHNPYKPSIIEWPVLDAEARERLVSLPIWDIAVQTEGKARQRVLSYAAMIKDTLLRRAVELDGFEEGRHKEVLSNLVEAYGIRLAPEPEYRRPHDPEWAFMVTGFSECIDSFFAFGLFALAKRSGFFPSSPCRYLRTGHAGGRPAYPVFCQLGGVAQTKPGMVAPPALRSEGAGGLDVSGVGAHRHRPRG